MQERRPHPRGGRYERLLLSRFFDLDDRGGGNLRLLGPHDMQPGKSFAVARPHIDHLRALDQAPRLQINAFFAVFQRQFDSVANQRLTRDQFELRRAMSGTERGDQPDAGGVAPDQHRAARHQVAVDARRYLNPTVVARGVFDHPLEGFERQVGVGQGMGEVEDRVAFSLAVYPAELQAPRRPHLVKHHCTRLPDRGDLCRVAKQHQCRKNLAQVIELALIQHRTFIDKADVQRFLSPFPALDEIATTQPRDGQSAGDGSHLVIKRFRPVKCDLAQPLDRRPWAVARQPFSNHFVLRVIQRGVEDAVNRRCRHPAQPQNRRRLVGRRKDRQGAAVFALAPFIIAGHNIDPRRDHRLVKLGQQHGFARSGLADNRHDRGFRLYPR